MNRKQKKMLIRILVSAALYVTASLLPVSGAIRFLAFMVPYLVIGLDILKKAGKGIRNRQPFNENFLMAVATVGAIALGNFAEGVAVMLLYQIGELFQSCAVGKSRRNIAALMDLRPDHANLEDGAGEISEVDPDEVEIGSVILVRPGERIPIDGMILEGTASLDTSALTGESIPKNAGPGDRVISGCIDQNGLLRIRTEKEFGESTASKILELVENAGSKKSTQEQFISKFAGVYTPVVCLSALALAFLPPVIRLLCGEPGNWNVWIYRALSFLVISCPCALVISIPLSFFAGLGGAGKSGILIKGSNYMETLSRVRCVVFDKTGTLTEGRFNVRRIQPSGCTETELLAYAAAAEHYSSHPISKSLRDACSSDRIGRTFIGDTVEYSGEGLRTEVDGHWIAVGNLRLMRRFGIDTEQIMAVGNDENDAYTGTAVYVADGSRFMGTILIGDEIKPGAAETIRTLRNDWKISCRMLTGDSKAVGNAVAKQLGLDEACCELLPADKVDALESIIGEDQSGTVIFVGDGINDAPVLTRADAGIAMGALGSDAAIEAADVVLMDDDPLKVATAIRISRRVLRIVKENIIFALLVKCLCLVLAALGITDMWAAIFADVGVMVIAVLNAIRAMKPVN